MGNTTKLIVGAGVGISLIAGTLTLLPNDPTITLNNPQKISWTKPTTDAQWAEDIKAENFDIKSTGVLQVMRDTHAAKLQRIINNNKKIVECPACVKYDIRANLKLRIDGGEVIENLEVSVENEYQNQLTSYQWDIEKLTQSVERMDNELRLRERGFVVVEGEETGLLGGSINPNYVRKIND